MLKDASATAIYGSRGANGVVIITTKRGRGANGTMTMNISQGYATVAKQIPVLNAYDFATYVNQSYVNIGQPENQRYGGSNMLGSLTPDSIRTLVGSGTDWQDEIFRTAPVSEAQMSFGGADDQGSYMVAGNWLQQTGVIRGSMFRRGGLRMNLDRNVVGPQLRISSNLAVTRSVNNMVRSSTLNGYQDVGIVRAALWYTPWMLPDSTRTDPRQEDPNTPGILGSNPLRYTDEVKELDQLTRGVGGAKLTATLPYGLILETSLGGNYEGRNYANYFPRTVSEGRGNGGDATQARTEFGDLLSENLLRYRHDIGTSQRIDAVGGFTYDYSRSTWFSDEVQTFADDILGYYVLQNGTNNRPPQTGVNTWVLASWLGRVNYSLLDRYLLTLTFRADGSSKFAENNKWSSFPAAALAWRVSSEPFMQRQQVISDLKLRVSYGKSGNQAIGPYQSLAQVSGVGSSVIFGDRVVAAYALNQLPNPDLKWETTDQYDAGLDLGAWNNRFTATVDVYSKRTYDLLQQIHLPTSTGFSTAWINSGEVTNKGIELSAGFDILRGDQPGALSWNISANASHNKNRIENLGGLPSQFAGRLGAGSGLEVTPFIQKPGLPIGAMWGYQTDGLIRTAQDSIDYAALGSPGFIGDYRLVDFNGDGELTPADQMQIGDANPNWVWAVSNRWAWGKFDLSALVTAVQGNSIINTQRISYLQLDGQGRNLPKEYIENSFNPTTNPDGKYPIIRNNRPGYGKFLDVFVEDGSYVRLKNVELGYQFSLPRARSARVYVSGTNLLTSTHYTGFDPEVSAFGSVDRPGVDMGSYPVSRQISVGINTSF